MNTINAGVGGFCWRPDKNGNEYYVFLMALFMRGEAVLLVVVASN